jgi:hypothetical protein
MRVSGFGQALAGQGQFAEAERMIVQGFSELVENRKSFRGDPALMLHEALDAVVEFYRRAGDAEKAAEWERKRTEL